MIYLASNSPRRKELLQEAGYEVTVIPSHYEESNIVKTTPYTMVMEQAIGKASATDAKYREDGIVLGGDTIVVIDGRILGKPVDEEDARRMLHRLSGREHEVVTGVCILVGDFMDVFYISTKITFHSLSADQIDSYIATGSPLDKAGAYGIQDLDETWICSVAGSISNVIGLPIEAVQERLSLLRVSREKGRA